MSILGQNAITKSVFFLAWVLPPTFWTILEKLQIWKRGTSRTALFIILTVTAVMTWGTQLVECQHFRSSLADRNQLVAAGKHLVNSWL